MTRTITTAAELDALPVGSVVVEGDHTTPDPVGNGQFATIPGVFHRFPGGWYVVAGYGERAPEEILPATVLHDPSAPAPVVSDAAVEVYPFHARIDGMSDLFHVKCSRHPEFGFCGSEAEATQARVEHLSTHEIPAAPSATREDVAREIIAHDECTTGKVGERWWTECSCGQGAPDDPVDATGWWDGHRADALLARFTITPRTDR